MESLLKIASRVEAAAEAYGNLKPVSNLEKWRSHFDQEKVSAVVMPDPLYSKPQFELG
jgi:hypothetical protein